MVTADLIVEDIKSFGDAEYAAHHYGFFQCFEGGYGDGEDRFCGIRAPDLRRLVKKYWRDISWENLGELISHRLHEVRLFAACVMAEMYGHGDTAARRKVVDFYLKHTRRLNNWDLVDISCYKILGRWCFERGDYKILFKLADSKNLWEQRIAMVATWWPVHNGDFGPTLAMAAKALHHRHDLMHKAAGWMLREAGKQGEVGHRTLIGFLDENSGIMPRTMLRYAIERLGPELRKRYMGK
ncbi:MAG: DNA alkylation repair protein [Rickettsiales bacterium]|jgi:3-methyladenine DNA glycosylase AlkD|nr:DNA alkylation repair protein [Rickettsiales bacterium]